jgi:hypothetical protein
MIEIVSKYHNKEFAIGEYDCNILWMEIYENEVYKKMLNNYKTFEAGGKLAYKLTGYFSILDYIKSKRNYKRINNNKMASAGNFFIKDKHISICLGNKTLTLVNDKFILVDTSIFYNDKENLLYVKKEN